MSKIENHQIGFISKIIYDQLRVKSRLREKYRAFVELGIDEKIAQFYNKKNRTPYLGGEAFRDWAYSQRTTSVANVSKQAIQLFQPPISDIVTQAAKTFKVNELSILKSCRGRVKNNIPRWVAMYLSQEICSKKLNEIAKTFNLKRTGSIPTTVSKLKVLMEEDLSLKRKVNYIIRQYDT